MRLFIAITIPQEVHDYVLKLQKLFKESIRGTFPKEFHLTLKFLGDTQPDKVEEVKQRLQKITFKPFECRLTKIGTFPEKEPFRVVWVGVEPDNTIRLLQQQIEDALKGMYTKELRFHRHLTIARVKGLKDKTAFEGYLKDVEQIKWNVDKIHVIQSKLSQESPVYTKIQSIPP